MLTATFETVIFLRHLLKIINLLTVQKSFLMELYMSPWHVRLTGLLHLKEKVGGGVLDKQRAKSIP